MNIITFIRHTILKLILGGVTYRRLFQDKDFSFLNDIPNATVDEMQSMYEFLHETDLDLFEAPRVFSIEETIQKIVVERRSLSRFGDGEFLIALEVNELGYQDSDSNLAERLRCIISSRDDEVMISIPNCFGSLRLYREEAQSYWRVFLPQYRNKINDLICMDYKYHDTNISRPYKGYKDKSHSAKRFDGLKRIWNNQKVVLIEGSYSRLGVGNDLFDGVTSLSRLICPAKSAFSQYEKILSSIIQHSTKDNLILLALGPTASVLAYDLAKMGYWAVDIGNIDLDYTWFLQNDETCAPIKNRYCWFAKDGGVLDEKFYDEKYESQILEDLS